MPAVRRRLPRRGRQRRTCSTADRAAREEDAKDDDGNIAAPVLAADQCRQLRDDLDVYNNLRAAELAKKSPSAHLNKKVQKARADVVDWLVQVTEDETQGAATDVLHLAVNYVDRCLPSVDVGDCRELWQVGAACCLIATKHEHHLPTYEHCHPFWIKKEDLFSMEVKVLKRLKYDLTVPTAKSFLGRFVLVARGREELGFLADFIAELSLLQGNLMFGYPPSLIAAAAVFLARFILQPTRHPWSLALRRYTLYRPCDLRECVNGLHLLVGSSATSKFPSIRAKYGKPKYKSVAKRYSCIQRIPPDFFHNPTE